MSFPDPNINDAEATNFAARLEDRYNQGDMQEAHGERPTRVDPLGYARWISAYVVKRANGADHEGATRMVLAEIDQIVHGTPPPVTPPETPATQTTFVARRGLVRAGGKVFVDDNGPFHPLGTTLFWALRGWKFERERLRANLAFAAKYVDYVRILGEVGWQDKTNDGSVFIDPMWTDYEQVVGEFLDCAYNEYGMRVEISAIGGGSKRDYMDLARKLANAVRGREPKVMHFEGANEPFNESKVTEQALRSVVDVFANTGILVAMGSARNGGSPEETLALMAGTRANVATLHLDRDDKENTGGWRQVKQAWDMRDLPCLASQNEPPGPASSGGQNTDPLQLAMMRAHGALAGVGAYVLHCGAGVTGMVDPSRGRPANIYEVPNAAAIFQAVKNVEKLLPTDIENWRRYNTWWPGNPLLVDAVWTDGPDHGVVQMQSAVSVKNFVSMPLGLKGYVLIKAQQPCQVEVGHPATGQILETRQLAKDERFKLSGPEEGGLGAYILRGTM